MGEYKEILRLDKMLTELGIEHKMVQALDGWRIKGIDGTAFEHKYSFGHDDDLIEVKGFGIKSTCIKGYLKAENALEFFLKWGNGK